MEAQPSITIEEKVRLDHSTSVLAESARDAATPFAFPSTRSAPEPLTVIFRDVKAPEKLQHSKVYKAIDLAHSQASRFCGALRACRELRLRWARLLPCVGFAILLGVIPYIVLREAPGEVIRLELKAAAKKIGGQFLLELSSGDLDAMRRGFYGNDVSIAPAPGFAVTVTLHGLMRRTCLDVVANTRRIDGRVAIALQGYATAEDCHDENDMTWRISP